MKRGFDSPDERGKRYSNRHVVERLKELRSHYNDPAWLLNNADDLYGIIRTGVFVPPIYDRAVEALFAIAPHMLTRDDFRRWSELFCDALAVTSDLKNDKILTRIYHFLGQSYTLSGEVRPARAAFDTVIEHASERQANEMLLLAYIGLFKTQSYHINGDFTPELVKTVLALAKTVDDGWYSASLHYALTLVYNYRVNTTAALGHGQMAYAYWHQLGDR